ncbi:MAG: TIR domain-containing protein [Pseudomonadota bacterium]
MADVFLSYSRDDQSSARRFAESLKREGFSVWWDQSLSAGEAFDRVTEQALDDAKAVVVLWSRKSVESRWVRAEATQALANGRLVPVMIEPCRRPIMFELTHTADLTGWEGDADEQWSSFIDGLRRLVNQAGAGATGAPVPAIGSALRKPRKRLSRPVVAVLAGVSAAAGALAAWLFMNRNETASAAAPIHVSLPFIGKPGGFPIGTQDVAIAADGSAVAFSSFSALQIRSLRSSEAVTIAIECSNPFFSPDAAWVGCWKQPNLVKFPVTGGAPVSIAPLSERSAGASWGSTGTIVFATTEGLFRVAEGGGNPELIAAPERERGEQLLAWPQLLPDDQALLFTVLASDLDKPPQIGWLDLRSRERRVVLTGGSSARYLPSGHLVYASTEKLFTIPFDPQTGKTRGIAAVLPDLRIALAQDNAAADFAFSSTGTLVSIPPSPAAGGTELFWVDRQGTRTSLGLEPGRYAYPRVSPDGKRIAIEINNGKNRDLWIWDLRRTSLTPLTRGPSEDLLPEWNVDGSRVFFASNRSGTLDVYSQAADGADDARVEYAGPGAQVPQPMTPDGKQLIVFNDFKTLNILELGKPVLQPLPSTGAEVWLSAVSPDGRWIAYESKESGAQTEIFLRPFPDMNSRREKISVDGGRYPLWSRTGKDELFYVDLKGGMMSVDIRLNPELQVGKVTKLFDWRPPPASLTGRLYDVSPVDGRFVIPVYREGVAEATQVPVVLNWTSSLAR